MDDCMQASHGAYGLGNSSVYAAIHRYSTHTDEDVESHPIVPKQNHTVDAAPTPSAPLPQCTLSCFVGLP